MMSTDQIRASVDSLQAAPENESLDQVAVRAAHWLLTLVAGEDDAIAMTASLYERAIAGDVPIAGQWEANEKDLARARALALARARARTLALALARARARTLALALARARARARALALDLARARDLALDLALDLGPHVFDDALISILGSRLQPMTDLHVRVRDSVERGDLDMSTWHTCETTHCRAGWAITIHSLGADLERLFGPEWAGRVIYKVSTGMVPDFFARNSDAIADIRRCAGVQP